MGLSITLSPSSFDAGDVDEPVGIAPGPSSDMPDDSGTTVVDVITVLEPPGDVTVVTTVLNLVSIGGLSLGELSGKGVAAESSSVVGGGGGGVASVVVSRNVGLGGGNGAGASVMTSCVNPGVNGCVSSISRSSSFQRICKAGPTVQSAVLPVGPSTVYPQTPPRKSVVSEVHV